MSFLSRIFSLPGSAATAAKTAATSASGATAKERLSLIIAHQRGSNLLAGVNVQQLQSDVMKVVERHIAVAKNEPISFNIRNDGSVNLFEMQLQIDDDRKQSVTMK